jgi:hypothetical protein
VGIAKPAFAPSDPMAVSHAVTIATTSDCVYDGIHSHVLPFPCMDYSGDAVGAVYHFTADLSTGSVRVRPVLPTTGKRSQPHDNTQTEWIIAKGIANLGACRAIVAMRCVDDCCTLLLCDVPLVLLAVHQRDIRKSRNRLIAGAAGMGGRGTEVEWTRTHTWTQTCGWKCEK